MIRYCVEGHVEGLEISEGLSKEAVISEIMERLEVRIPDPLNNVVSIKNLWIIVWQKN